MVFFFFTEKKNFYFFIFHMLFLWLRILYNVNPKTRISEMCHLSLRSLHEAHCREKFVRWSHISLPCFFPFYIKYSLKYLPISQITGFSTSPVPRLLTPLSGTASALEWAAAHHRIWPCLLSDIVSCYVIFGSLPAATLVSLPLFLFLQASFFLSSVAFVLDSPSLAFRWLMTSPHLFKCPVRPYSPLHLLCLTHSNLSSP